MINSLFPTGDGKPARTQINALLTIGRGEDWVQPPVDRILLIDDKAEMRELLTQLFRQWSYTTVAAATVEEARQAVLTQGPFQMVVCDFELPDGNGLQFWSWLRQERRDGARFLLMSGSASFMRHRSADFAFLAKPFRPEELRSSVVELLGTRTETSQHEI